MPQFDTFSFFSQLFWVLLGFSYLYLLLCYYILPAFAAVLKIRAKKLVQTSTKTSTLDVVATPISNSLFFENLTIKLNNISFFRESLNNDISGSYEKISLKNDAFYKFNFLILNDLKIITFFI